MGLGMTSPMRQHLHINIPGSCTHTEFMRILTLRTGTGDHGAHEQPTDPFMGGFWRADCSEGSCCVHNMIIYSKGAVCCYTYFFPPPRLL